MSAHPDINVVIDGIADRKVPGIVMGVGGLLVVIGLVAAGYGFAVAGAAPTWGAILVGLFWSIGLCQGAFMLSIILTGTWGRWGRPIKRIAESFWFVLPVLYVLLAGFLLFGGLGIYKWHPTPLAPIEHISIEPHNVAATWRSKPIWLTPGFFIARQLGGLLILMILDFVYLRASLGPDMLQAQERLGKKAPGWWNSFIGGQSNVKRASEAGQAVQSTLFWMIGLAYALVFSFLAFDLLMSLEPWWYTNMFGGWVFVSCVWTGFCAVGVTSMLARDWLNLGDWIKPKVTHDLGKLMLAACMFWAYTLFAQLLPVWYANMPEETQFFLVRIGGEEGGLTAWRWMAQTVPILCFVAPFTILLSRGVKKMRWPFVAICSLILFGMFMERSLIVMPQVYPDVSDTFPTTHFLVLHVGVWLGFVGLITLVVSNVLARIPPLVTSDPHLGDHPWDQHVHSLDAHHAH
ncbi:MAG: hypothetical protein H6737_24985 [Alphaproteobacteria bacterium]|nr:hypothetical protein [Alphaproteobacteria bacterium]